MASKAVSILTPAPLDLRATQNNRDAVADIPRRLAGNAAWLAGYINGGDLLDNDTPNPAPRCPLHGLKGHGHTGKRDGRPFFHQVALFSLGTTARSSSNLSANTSLGVAGPFGSLGDLGASDEAVETVGPPLVLDNPGCDPEGGAFVELFVAMKVWILDDTNVAAGDQLTITLRNLHPRGRSASFVLSGSTIAGTTPPELVYVASATKGTDTLRAVAGELNVLQLVAKFETSATAGAREHQIEIDSVLLGVFET